MKYLCNRLVIICALLLVGLPGGVYANFLVITPDQVVVNAEGLFVSINEHIVQVETLSAANDGYIIAIITESHEDEKVKLEICPICRNETYIPGRYCTTCGFPIWSKKQLR